LRVKTRTTEFEGLSDVKIEVLRPGDLTAAQLDRWMALQTADPAFDSPFLSPQWAQAIERAQMRPGAPDPGLRVAVIGDGPEGDGFFAAKTGAFSAIPAGAPMSDYQGVVCTPGLEIDPQALVRALGVTRLDFNHMLKRQTAFAPYVRGEEQSWIIDVSAGYTDYERQTCERTSALKDTNKKRRRIEREVGPCRFTAMSRSSTDFRRLIDLKRAQMKNTRQTDILDVGWTMRLLDELFERQDPDFGGALFTLHVGDVLAATHFHLRSRHTIHGWLIAHNPDFERFSPGMLLFQDILQWMDSGPYRRLDLGCGGYRFKRELSNVQQGIGHGFVGVPSPATLVRSVAYGVRDVAESLPLGRVSALPAKAMRRLDILRALR
jgi:CelD/BcsL family acetyltransferase involved in cellulose biosynthesis